jgi:hypothetical protein
MRILKELQGRFFAKNAEILDLQNIKELACVPVVQISKLRVALSCYIVKYFIISLSNRMKRKGLGVQSWAGVTKTWWSQPLCESPGSSYADSEVGLDGDVYGAGAEGADKEPGEAAGAIDGEEFELVAGGDVQIERLPIPSIVDAQAMAAGGDGNRDGVAVHEFGDWFAVELHDDLAKLDVIRRGATDGDLRL